MVNCIDALCTDCGEEIRVLTGDFFLCDPCFQSRVGMEINKDINN